MNMIKFALQKPIAIMVLVLGLLFFGFKATKEIKVDILPEMDLPVVYIAHSFNGYTPQQMEGYFTKMYVNMMLFTNGIKSIESKNTQGLTLMKITFYEGTEMGEAIATINALSNRSQVFLPPGAPPPFIIRFDASSQPVGQLVFRSATKTNNQLQDIATGINEVMPKIKISVFNRRLDYRYLFRENEEGKVIPNLDFVDFSDL